MHIRVDPHAVYPPNLVSTIDLLALLYANYLTTMPSTYHILQPLRSSDWRIAYWITHKDRARATRRACPVCRPNLVSFSFQQVQRAGTDDYRTMGSVHFSCVHNLRVSASVILLAIFAHYQGAEVRVGPHSRLMVSAGNDNSLSIYWQCMWTMLKERVQPMRFDLDCGGIAH